MIGIVSIEIIKFILYDMLYVDMNIVMSTL